jgi:hypothetical protein
MNRPELSLDIEALRKMTGYAHWIPHLRGIALNYFERNFPGWTWNQIIPVLIKAEILVKNAKDPTFRELSQGFYVASDFESVRLWMKNGETEVSVTRKINQESFKE